jgi:hypothetical protein
VCIKVNCKEKSKRRRPMSASPFRANLGFCPVGPPLVGVPLAPEQLDLACRQAAALQMQETEMHPRPTSLRGVRRMRHAGSVRRPCLSSPELKIGRHGGTRYAQK